MKTLAELQKQYYEEFKGSPSFLPIVRNGQQDDAFELVVLKVLYGKILPDFSRENAIKLSNYIIAPPDNGIDIFFQHESGDESSFDVIQVKHSELDEAELRECIVGMERTINDFCKNPKSVKSESCRQILSQSNLDKTNKNKCTYYVVHLGTVDDFSGSEENEKIITINALDIIYRNISEHVDKDDIVINTNMKYGNPDDNNGAVVCSINGFDLASLCNSYYSTEIGRNILFGSNLRESLIDRKSKPYLSMSNTILHCPENFWYYNNGITIIARDIIEIEPEKVELRGFSIVNGAQTTSALGLFLREAKKNQEEDKIANLRKVFVLARILKVPDEQMRQDIAIFNNTQNPITSRDMVANRPEQKHLYEWMLDESYPQIYVEIRRGASLPAGFNKGIEHRITTNEELAQLVYASFLQQPFTAKDKRKTLFNNDYTQTDYVINKIYHDVFNWDEEDPSKNGLVFKKTKREIDEVLFIRKLYKYANTYTKNILQKRIQNAKELKDAADNQAVIKTQELRIATNSLYLDTVGICMFYFVALYYEFKEQFADDPSKTFNFEKYYSDKVFRNEMIEETANLFLMQTVKVLVKTAQDNGRSGNVNNWVRSPQCEPAFLTAMRDDMASDLELEQKYHLFCQKYKV